MQLATGLADCLAMALSSCIASCSAPHRATDQPARSSDCRLPHLAISPPADVPVDAADDRPCCRTAHASARRTDSPITCLPVDRTRNRAARQTDDLASDRSDSCATLRPAKRSAALRCLRTACHADASPNEPTRRRSTHLPDRSLPERTVARPAPRSDFLSATPSTGLTGDRTARPLSGSPADPPTDCANERTDGRSGLLPVFSSHPPSM